MNFPQCLLSCLNSSSWNYFQEKQKSGISLSKYFSPLLPSSQSSCPNPPPPIILAGYTLYMPFFLEFCFCLFFFCFFFTNQTMKSLLNYMIRVLFSFFLIFCDSSTSPVSFQEWSETRGCCH